MNASDGLLVCNLMIELDWMLGERGHGEIVPLKPCKYSDDRVGLAGLEVVLLKIGFRGAGVTVEAV